MDNGECNTKKTSTYDDAFPGVGSSDRKSFWIKAKGAPGSSVRSDSPPKGLASEDSVTNYLFTSLLSEKLLGRKVSFRVRFRSTLPSVTIPSTLQRPSQDLTREESTDSAQAKHKEKEGDEGLVESTDKSSQKTLVPDWRKLTANNTAIPGSYYLAVIIHSAASGVNFQTTRISSPLFSSLPAIGIVRFF